MFAFYWVWALKNRTFGPIFIDGGVLTFLPGVLSGLLHHVGAQSSKLVVLSIASCLIVFLNFSIPCARYLKKRTLPWEANNARNLYAGKPDWWVKVFVLYVYISTGFWFYCAATSWMRAENEEKMAGLLVTLMMAGGLPAALKVLNAPVLARFKKEKEEGEAAK